MEVQFQATLREKLTMPCSQQVPSKPYIINNVEDIVVFLGLNVFKSDNSYMFSCRRNAQVTFFLTMLRKH